MDAVQAVGAQQQDVAERELALVHGDVDGLARPEHVGQHVAHRVTRDFVGAQAGILRQDLGRPRVVDGELLQTVLREQVDAAVADRPDATRGPFINSPTIVVPMPA